MSEAEHFKDTWPVYQRDDVDPFALDTDIARAGWPKPTIYREHETIHLLLNDIDLLRKEVENLRGMLSEATSHETEPCRLDHNGDCQEHGYHGGPCLIPRARAALGPKI